MTQLVDQKLQCCDCPNEFLFSARDQEFFSQQGYTPPRRCKPCRDAKKLTGSRGPAHGTAPRQFQSQPVVTQRPEPTVQFKKPAFVSAPVQAPPPQFREPQRKVTKASGDTEKERRRDAYQERQQRRNRNRDWQELESFED